ncbi:MAG: hypothetical protein ISS31_00550 [Kiritimatiellae bacterium]|nr:hypothetical protein [Kiritimatiellia bacterium]
MNYRRFNIVVLLALLALGPALLVVPWAQEHLGLLYPGCALEQLTGRSCPMCGLTTGLRDLVACNTGHGPANPLTVPVAILVLLETAARAMLCTLRLSAASVERTKRWDLRLHAVLLVAYAAYCVTFYSGHA